MFDDGFVLVERVDETEGGADVAGYFVEGYGGRGVEERWGRGAG